MKPRSENKIKRTTLINRLKNAVRAFRGCPIQSLTLGLDIKRCDQCDYKSDAPIREHLMVIMGARAAYMEYAEMIDIPGGLGGEGELVWFVRKTVNSYIQKTTDGEDINFDNYIETALLNEYSTKSLSELYEDYKREWCEVRGYDMEAMDEEVGMNGECYACFDEWYVSEYAMMEDNDK